MTRIAYVSTYVPQRCGLATYTYHVRKYVALAKGDARPDPVCVLVRPEHEPMDDPHVWPIRRDHIADYIEMAERLNQSDVDVVSLQHEFGIFGGEAGAHVLHFIRHLRKPLITTFHTVFEQPAPPYAPIQREIAERSTELVVMNRKAADLLHRSFHISKSKIRYIPHGTPTPAGIDRDKVRRKLGWTDRKVLMTFGLLSRGKGIESLLAVLPEVVRQVPNTLYAIVGQTHPEVRKWEGERYREELLDQVRKLGLEQHVTMIDRYMEEDDLIRHLVACDLYVTPYPGLQQITSGTLAYAVGLGRPVVTTPYVYAVDLLEGCDELFIHPDRKAEWAGTIAALLKDDRLLDEWSRKIYAIGKTMHWTEVGKRYLEVFNEVGSLAHTQV